MQRNFRIVLAFLTIIILSSNTFAQEVVKYKDVFLDGKPAKLNVATGEVTFVKETDKKKPKASNSIEASTEEINTESASDFHVVKQGETLLKIANRYNTSLTELKRANNLSTTLVDEGQKLRVKNLEAVTTDTITQPTSLAKNLDVHIVEKGQTLYSIARLYNISLSELKSHNGLNSNLIKVGQELLVANFDTVVDEGHGSVWTVSKGDTLYRIALNNGTTVNAIKRLNGLTSNTIKIGQKLKLK